MNDSIIKPRKCLITGAAGFLGGHLMRYLEKHGYTVEGMDNFMHSSENPIKKRVQYGDVRYYQDIEKHVEWADIVIHMAAQIHVDKSIYNPQETIDINVTGTLNVLEACKKFNKRMIFASTSEVYGTAQTKKIGEDHPLDAQSPYGASKVAGDRLCKAYRDSYGLDVTILRNFNTFGPYQNDGSYGSVISIFARRALNNENLQIFGDGEQERDYMYVNDAIQGYLMCIENPGIDVINVGTGKAVKINALAKMVLKLLDKQDILKIEHITSRPGEVMRLCANVKKAKELGFISETKFQDNLREYLNWYKKQYEKNSSIL